MGLSLPLKAMLMSFWSLSLLLSHIHSIFSILSNDVDFLFWNCPPLKRCSFCFCLLTTVKGAFLLINFFLRTGKCILECLMQVSTITTNSHNKNSHVCGPKFMKILSTFLKYYFQANLHWHMWNLTYPHT